MARDLKSMDTDLYLRGDGVSARNVFLGRQDTANDVVYVDTTKVAVGHSTTAPQSQLHVGALTGGDGTQQEQMRLSGDYAGGGSGALFRFTVQHNSGTTPNAGEYNVAGIGGFADGTNWGGGFSIWTSPQGTTGGAALVERVTVKQDGKVGIGSNLPTHLLDINSDSVRVRTAKTPASAGAAGTQGEIAWDADYVYVCIATNTWKRTALSTW